MTRTFERQYERCLENPRIRIGAMMSQTWREDPKRLGFVLARYKFVAKMCDGLGSILEVGCGDAWATRIVAQHVTEVMCIDYDPVWIAEAKDNNISENIEFFEHDIRMGPFGQRPAAFSLDTFEHIEQTEEDRFIRNMALSVLPHGVVIIGIPSLESQAHASPCSQAGHVNCK